MQSFGIWTGIGVLFGLFYSFTVVPAMLALINPKYLPGRAKAAGVVAGSPIVMQIAMSPTPFARELATTHLGNDGAMVLAAVAWLVGGTASVLLGSALLSSALAVTSPIRCCTIR